MYFDDILKFVNYKEPAIRRTCDTGIITVILIAAEYSGGNIHTYLRIVRSTGLIPIYFIKASSIAGCTI
ncbi:MAG: hypothetical protein LBT43_09355 [Prevotella sp.]|jgi:hypothetical protein|nr:hypothetical protein [Prevotella sp.]